MDFGTWIGTVQPPEAALLHGGSETMFEMIAANRFTRPTRILCTSELATELTLRATEADRRLPELLISRGLRNDLADLAAGQTEAITFIPNPMIQDYVTAEMRRVGSEADLVAGYPTPAPMLFAAVLSDLADRYAHAARRSRSVLVLHDRDAVLSVREPRFCRSFTMPEGTGGDHETGRLTPPVAAEDDAVTSSKLREHADFILSNDAQSLAAMHTTVRRPAFGRIQSFWIENLEHGTEGTDFVDDAREAAGRLRTLFAG